MLVFGVYGVAVIALSALRPENGTTPSVSLTAGIDRQTEWKILRGMNHVREREKERERERERAVSYTHLRAHETSFHLV